MAVPAERRRLPRRSLEETRALMLEAATKIVCAGTADTSEAAVSAALAHVRVKQVTEEATRIIRARLGEESAPAVTTGSIYQIWPAQADFQAELLFHLTSRQAQLVPSLSDSVRRFDKAVADGITWQDALNDVLGEQPREPPRRPDLPRDARLLRQRRQPTCTRGPRPLRQVVHAGGLSGVSSAARCLQPTDASALPGRGPRDHDRVSSRRVPHALDRRIRQPSGPLRGPGLDPRHACRRHSLRPVHHGRAGGHAP